MTKKTVAQATHVEWCYGQEVSRGPGQTWLWLSRPFLKREAVEKSRRDAEASGARYRLFRRETSETLIEED